MNQPQPNAAASADEPMTPMTVTTATMTPRVPMTLAMRSRASSSPFALASESTGTKAWLKAPSAKSLLKKFGMRFAKRNTSAEKPAPRIWAMMMSRIIPSMRERNVEADTISPDLRRLFLAN